MATFGFSIIEKWPWGICTCKLINAHINTNKYAMEWKLEYTAILVLTEPDGIRRKMQRFLTNSWSYKTSAATHSLDNKLIALNCYVSMHLHVSIDSILETYCRLKRKRRHAGRQCPLPTLKSLRFRIALRRQYNTT